ncbi:hypothetical protein RB195_016575 [Necator americanus]|uniref:Uncharacterized protein n=1 Tax=Necator americanus TaxID=51031 RepID=A0ABR1C3I0_NECAM
MLAARKGSSQLTIGFSDNTGRPRRYPANEARRRPPTPAAFQHESSRRWRGGSSTPGCCSAQISMAKSRKMQMHCCPRVCSFNYVTVREHMEVGALEALNVAIPPAPTTLFVENPWLLRRSPQRLAYVRALGLR